jgi:glycosyltransferase involved in cell wall biosynthesis
MKKVLVLNTAAEYAGALTILKSFLLDAREIQSIQWDVCIGVDTKLFDSVADNIRLLDYQWSKKSWFHRLFFDLIILPRIVKLNGYDHVLSLQNILLLSRNSTKKTLFVHQSLQFLSMKSGLFSIEGLKILMRKYLIGPLIRISTRRADFVLVQTTWMRSEINKVYGVSMERIFLVKNQSTDMYPKRFLPVEPVTFLYPAASGFLKNHDEIIDAMILLRDRYDLEPLVYFTIDPKENATAKRLVRRVQQESLNIQFTGRLTQERLFEMMTSSVILFSSRIESYGLPLYEAKKLNAPMIVKFERYAMEAIQDYPNGYLYESLDKLVDLMKSHINKQMNWVDWAQSNNEDSEERPSIVQFVIETMGG